MDKAVGKIRAKGLEGSSDPPPAVRAGVARGVHAIILCGASQPMTRHPSVRRRDRGRLARAVALAVLVGAVVGLGGCGVRGSLEAPAAEPTDTGNATPGTPGQPVPHKPSILDPILR